MLLFDAAALKSGESPPPDDSDKLDVLVLLLLLVLFVADDEDDFFDGLSLAIVLNSSLCLAILFGRGACEDVSIYLLSLSSPRE